MEVRIHNYSNPNSLLFNHSCCDMPCHTQNARCDNVFHYCLRSINTPELNKECSGGNRSDVNDDDAPLNFSQSMVLGLPNPLPLQGLTTEWRVRIRYKHQACMYIYLSRTSMRGSGLPEQAIGWLPLRFEIGIEEDKPTEFS